MASGEADLIASFQKFCSLAGKDKTKMTSKASGKLVADCWDKEFKKYDVKSIVDASVFPACKEKGKPEMEVKQENIKKYINKTAHEIAKRKTKNNKIAEDDAEVKAIKDKLCSLLGGPNVKEVKQSATGNVGGLTDTKNYTGAHKERFDAEGKGKGASGREDRTEHTGYVGNYKGDGTYDKK